MLKKQKFNINLWFCKRKLLKGIKKTAIAGLRIIYSYFRFK